MSDTDQKTDEQKFNDTLKRMLQTPRDPKAGKKTEPKPDLPPELHR